MYKYTPSQYFGPHYDDSVRDPETGAKSEWTVLVYLTGIEDGVKGGEVTGDYYIVTNCQNLLYITRHYSIRMSGGNHAKPW